MHELFTIHVCSTYNGVAETHTTQVYIIMCVKLINIKTRQQVLFLPCPSAATERDAEKTKQWITGWSSARWLIAADRWQFLRAESPEICGSSFPARGGSWRPVRREQDKREQSRSFARERYYWNVVGRRRRRRCWPPLLSRAVAHRKRAKGTLHRTYTPAARRTTSGWCAALGGNRPVASDPCPSMRSNKGAKLTGKKESSKSNVVPLFPILLLSRRDESTASNPPNILPSLTVTLFSVLPYSLSNFNTFLADKSCTHMPGTQKPNGSLVPLYLFCHWEWKSAKFNFRSTFVFVYGAIMSLHFPRFFFQVQNRDPKWSGQFWYLLCTVWCSQKWDLPFWWNSWL